MATHLKETRIARMVALADDYLTDADLLATTMSARSDADYLLRLVAFEILLKALRLTHGLQPGKNHSYRTLFEGLPAIIRQSVLSRAAERMGPDADYSQLAMLLDTFGRNFVSLRYSYEEYQGMTTEALRELEMKWLKAGARTEDATFTYHPKELNGLIFALRSEIRSSPGQPDAIKA